MAYVQQQLVPTLRPGDIVIMDNLSSHKIAGVRKAINAIGARVVYLQPYSPDFNPIEMLFAKLKYLVRTAAPGQSTPYGNSWGGSSKPSPQMNVGII